jgi:hypothetical protein
MVYWAKNQLWLKMGAPMDHESLVVFLEDLTNLTMLFLGCDHFEP